MKSIESVFNQLLAKLYKVIARFIARHPFIVIAVMLIVTAVCSVHVPFIKIEDDYKIGYTPRYARAMEELKIHSEFSNGELTSLIMLVTASDGGNMIRLSHLNATVKIMDEIRTKFKVKNQSFDDFCDSFCDINEAVAQFRNGLLMQESQTAKRNDESGSTFHANFNLSYPVMSILGNELDLSRNLYGVETYKCDETPTSATNIRSVHLIALMFRFIRPKQWTVKDAITWDESIRHHYLKENSLTKIVNINQYSIPYLQDEISKTSKSLSPYIVVGFIVMCAFSIISVYAEAKYIDQWTPYKAIYAVLACVTPLLATSTSLGLLLWFGVRFASILLITPFLVLSIGVDDAFMMISSWERVSYERSKKFPHQHYTVEDCVTEVLIDTGPSITITSLTNVFAFAIGAISAPPDIQLFCIANGIAMFLDLLYTVTVYLAILTIGGSYEMMQQQQQQQQQQHQIQHKDGKTFDFPLNDKTPNHHCTKHFRSIASVQSADGKWSNFWTSYCMWLSNPFTTVTIFALILGYWSISIYGITQINPGLTPQKLLLQDSPLIEVMNLRDRYIRNENTFVTVLIGDTGDLRNASTRDRIHSMVKQFESLPESRQSRFTLFWMRDYESFMMMDEANEVDETDANETDSVDDKYSFESIQRFLEWPEYSYWRGFMNIDSANKRISSFSIMTTYHGQNLSSYSEKLSLLKRWRNIVDNYTDLSASVFDDFAQFTDQIETLLSRAIKSSVYTFLSMMIVCYIFMPSISAVAAASLSVFSIFIGVVGFLTIWNIQLDPISTTTIILSIGMSVDYPAHITFHYHRATLQNTNKPLLHLMSNALSVIAYPLLQCCLSNIFLLSCLLLVSAYTSEVIVKTVLLVVGFGSVHALVVIPAFLCAAPFQRKYQVESSVQ